MNKKKAKSTFSYGELVKNFYGVASPNTMFDLNQFEGLIAQYYGRSDLEGKQQSKPPASPALALSFDNGEILFQPASLSQYREYIVQSLADELAFEEYVVNGDNLSMSSSMKLDEIVLPMEEPRVEQEYLLDVLQPIKETPASPAVQVETAPPPAANTTPTSEKPRQSQPSAEQPLQAAPVETSKATEADFMEDLQSILTGQKVFDPVSKKTVDKDKVGTSQSGQTQNNGSERPIPEAKNEQAIFDRIAQSMQYANTFDLGSVELENRFADFDKINELQENTRKKRSADANESRGQASAAAAKPSASDAKPPVDTADFLQDLDAIKKIQAPQQEASGEAPSLAYPTSQDYDGDYSRSMFDTGEHVMTAGDLYTDRLHIQGVPFSYGQIIAMADLYESVDQMISADPKELQTLKSLIVRTTNYYLGNKNNKALDVSNKEWEAATHKRFLKLAEDNYEHFSPELFFNANMPRSHGDYRSTWESYHRRAIEETQRLFLDPRNANVSIFPEWPLIINAFGDHFLTDAFASGHMFNKEEMIELFKANFLRGGDLKPEAKTFLGKVAALAFQGEVKAKFSKLETTESYGWWIFSFHPDINSTSRFQSVLEEALKQRPDAVANLAVKALHDRLNKLGLEVTNKAGDPAWMATGDTFMNAKTLVIARKAVRRSADNIADGSIMASNLDFDWYFQKVWQHVPVLSSASDKLVKELMQEYSNPKSDILVKAAAEIIKNQVDAMIGKFKDEKKLRDA